MPKFDWDALGGIARLAGQAIMAVYATEFTVEHKADDSPVTQADRAANQVIVDSLTALHPDIPILSEESAQAGYAERKAWKRFWLVDPMDGTKEFVARNGEFTVNIALVEGRRPVFGVVYLPVTDVLYAGGAAYGSLRRQGGGAAVPIHGARPAPGEPLVVVKSRSHPDARLAAWLERFPVRREVTAGSSLKFCLVAEGAAHCYPRFNPTWERDTAAGQAVIEGAGGTFTAMGGGEFLYNKENLVNGGFEAQSWKG